MKKDLISRYERDSQGVLIDVAAGRTEDLYNNFDRNSPHIRRDLDSELVDYLSECARELGKEPFSIRFTLATPPDEAQQTRIQGSVHGYFVYLAQLEREKVFQMMRRSAVFLGIGIGILFAAVLANQTIDRDRSVIGNVFAEGLTIAAWVSLWEALATFIIELFPRRREIQLFRKLAGARLVFRSEVPPSSI